MHLIMYDPYAITVTIIINYVTCIFGALQEILTLQGVVSAHE